MSIETKLVYFPILFFLLVDFKVWVKKKKKKKKDTQALLMSSDTIHKTQNNFDVGECFLKLHLPPTRVSSSSLYIRAHIKQSRHQLQPI